MLIEAASLKRLVADIFRAEGCSTEESDRVALYLVNANLAGHDSHGVLKVPRYLSWIRAGHLKRDQEMSIVTESDAFALVDGHYGLGQTIAPQAVRLGIEKARKSGVAVIGLRNAGHIGRVGEWAEMAVAANLTSIHFVNVAGSRFVAPFGGVDRRMSTAPIAIGVPMGDREPIVLDFSTAAVAEGKVMVAAKGGKALPDGCLIEPDGALSSDPRTLYGDQTQSAEQGERAGVGAIRAMGEHKGSGLALICELLAGALTGSGCAGPANPPVANGMLSIYVAPERFGSAEAIADEARRYVEWVKASRPAVAGGAVLSPGEPERMIRRQRLAEGVPLPDDAWRALGEAARGMGLDPDLYRAAGANSAEPAARLLESTQA